MAASFPRWNSVPPRHVATPAHPSRFAATILGKEGGIGLLKTVLAATGFATGEAVVALEAQGIEALVAIGTANNLRPG